MVQIRTFARIADLEMERPLARLADLALWIGLLALFGFVCDPDSLWFPIRFGAWAGSLLFG